MAQILEHFNLMISPKGKCFIINDTAQLIVAENLKKLPTFPTFPLTGFFQFW